MTKSEVPLRVIIALTESSSIGELWAAAMQAMHGSSAELLAIFLHDERWQRAASLPFTREVSLAGGATSDFTVQRAAEVLSSSAAKLQRAVEELAQKAGLSVSFQVLPESDEAAARRFLAAEASVVVGPAGLAGHPLFVELQQTDLRIVLIESTDRTTEAPGSNSLDQATTR